MTSTPSLACVVMAGGKGTRMHSQTPKLLHPLCGRPLLHWMLAAVAGLEPERTVVVVPPDQPELEQLLPPGAVTAVQSEARGTGDAVASALPALAGWDGDVLVVNGDHPLADSATLGELVAAHRAAAAAATVLTIERTGSIGGDFGRVVRDDAGAVERIVEVRDASPAERELREVNSGYYVFAADALRDVLPRLSPANDQSELYVTEAIGLLAEAGRPVAAHHHEDAAVARGVNSRVDLAGAGAVLRARINEAHMLAGVTIVDPASTHIDAGCELAADSVIEPFCVLRGDTRVAAGAVVGPHAVLVSATVGERARVGPFCYLRPGTVLEPGSKAGTFVELKNAHIGEDSKVPHLSYLGDAEVGAGSNVGAGNITANFDGRSKHRTVIGRNVRTSCDTVFVAPVTLGDGSWTAAGSVITDDVPPDALAVARSRQRNVEGYGKRKRD